MSMSAKIVALILPALLVLSAVPSQAQNRGAPGRTGGGVPAVRSAPRVSAPARSHSAPRVSAPARSHSAPRSSAPARSYSPPRANTTRSYSAPRAATPRAVSSPVRSNVIPNRATTIAPNRTNSPTYRTPLVRQTVTPGVNSNYSTYRATQPSSTAMPSVSPGMQRNGVGGVSPSAGARYPGRINNTAARVVNPNGSYSSIRNTNYVTPSAATTARPSSVLPNGVNRNGVPGVSPSRQVNRNTTQLVTRPGLPPVQTPVTVNNYNNYYNSPGYAARYRDCDSRGFYSNYNYRRGYRYYTPCYTPFLSLGFFAARPYSYYNYSQINYVQPFVYGDDNYYRAAPLVDNQVAATQPAAAAAPVSLEQEMLTELARYVETHSKQERFQIADPAFGGQLWNLDLTQAPAVYSIDSNHYSVVTGFEGTLGDNSIPSSVGVEFFVARDNGRWTIKDAWIVSANGIPRAKKFQSPTYPQVQTWQAGEVCPFSGLPMVPVAQGGPQG